MRSASSIEDISRLTNSAGTRRWMATYSAMFVAKAVLPMLGRAARIDQFRVVQAAGQAVQVGETRWPRRPPCARRASGRRCGPWPRAGCRGCRGDGRRAAVVLDGEDLLLGLARAAAWVRVARRRRRGGSRCWRGSATAAWPCRGRSGRSNGRGRRWAPTGRSWTGRRPRRRPRSRPPVFSRSTSSVTSILPPASCISCMCWNSRRWASA